MTNLRLINILVFAIGFLVAANFLEAKDNRKPNAMPSYKYTLSQKEWTKQMLHELPSAFCDDREYFGQCFSVEKPECEKLVSLLAKACFKGIDIPKTVRLATVGLRLGHQLGTCIGSQYEQTMSRKKKKHPQCQEIKEWL